MLFSTPLLRTVNLSIAVFIGALLAAAYWFAWRPLPQTSGELAAPISQKAAIVRDSQGVPHISAASWEDAIFLQGFATAQDRMWQMDALRRLAAGELAEVVGRGAFEADREARLLGMARIAEAEERVMTPQTRTTLAAYARGVNYYLETHRGRLPLEFTLLNYQPRPWRVRDTLLTGLQMHRTLTSSWRDEIRKARMLEKGDPSKVSYLYPVNGAPDASVGSNSWAISSARSANGRPILANDPHLDFTIPATWYMLHLRAPDLDVTGFSLPGVPAVIVGHNQHIAWGVTNLGFDVQDLYREQIDTQTGRYVFRGQVEQARMQREAIAVKGEKRVDVNVWITRHGPVILSEGGQSYALRWAPAATATFELSFPDLNRARNWDEFNAALARYHGPGQNFTYADDQGNIGHHAAGILPIRNRCPGDTPSDGASGECEWNGFIPYQELPQIFNPPSGLIVTANQNPFPPDYRYPVNGEFAAPYRARQIHAALESKNKWKAEEILGVQKDVYAGFSYFLARQTVAAWDRKPGSGASSRAAVEILRNWNGQMEKGAAAPMIATLLYIAVRDAAAERAAPGASNTYAPVFGAAVVERLLRERPDGWFPDFDQLLLDCLSKAVAAGEKRQGSKISRWDWGQYLRLTIVHPVGSQLPLIGRYFNVGPVPMSGSGYTIKATSERLGPSMRMIVDFGDLDHSLANLTIGESGHFLSRHYKDQWKAYYAGRSFRMQFQQVDAAETLTVNPR